MMDSTANNAVFYKTGRQVCGGSLVDDYGPILIVGECGVDSCGGSLVDNYGSILMVGKFGVDSRLTIVDRFCLLANVDVIIKK
jgi:hypothetical protein